MVLLQRRLICTTPLNKRTVTRVHVDKGRSEWDWTGYLKEAVLGSVVGFHLLCVSAFPDLSLAVLNAPPASLPRTAEAALRRSIPAFNPNVLEIQRLMESISGSLRIPQRKPWGTMQESVETARALLEDRGRILEGVPGEKLPEGEVLVRQLEGSLGKLQLWIGEQNPDRVSLRVADVLRSISDLELLQTPGLPYLIPRAYSDQPRLAGRAIVELQLEREGNSVEPIEIVLDGYSAPLSAGVFARNVVSHSFDQQELRVDRDSIVLRTQSSEAKSLPLEILPVGQFEPLYRSELDVQTGEVPVLPLSIFGSVSLSHALDGEEMSSSEEAFIFKFNRATAGLGGMAFDEGRFSVIGYVTKGLQSIQDLHTGDTILSAEITKGRENLIEPAT